MPVESDTTLGPIYYLVILFAIVPFLLYLLSRAAAPGLHPEPFQIEEMRKLADQLHLAAEKAVEEASHRFGSRSGERRALDDLLQLAERAEHFRSRMQERGVRLSGMRQKEFFLLENSFERAQAGFNRLEAYRVFPAPFQGLIQTLNSLRYYFDTRAEPLPAVTEPESTAPVGLPIAAVAGVGRPRGPAVEGRPEKSDRVPPATRL